MSSRGPCFSCLFGRRLSRVAAAGALVTVSLGGSLLGGGTAFATNSFAPGTVSVIAGTGAVGAPVAGPALSSPISEVSSVAYDASGNLYIADAVDGDILKVDHITQALSVVAGDGTNGSTTAGAATSTSLNHPRGIAFDGSGNLYIANTNNNQIDVVTSGMLAKVAGTGTGGTPTAGPATSSNLSSPIGIALDSSGNLFIADSGNHDVEKVTTVGTLSVVAGNNSSGMPTAGTATSSQLGGPVGLVFDGSGNLFVSDNTKNVVVKIASNVLSIVAGSSAGTAGTPTPGPATSSLLDGPGQISLDPSGNLYIPNALDSEVVSANVGGTTPTGNLSITAGNGSSGVPVAGLSTYSALGFVPSVAFNAGKLAIADASNRVVEQVNFAPSFVTQTPAADPTVGTPYTYQIVTAGTPDATYSLASGTLPNGLTLNATTGVISGTPTATGSAVISITATNSAGSSSTSGITLTVVEPTQATTTIPSTPTTGPATPTTIPTVTTPTVPTVPVTSTPAPMIPPPAPIVVPPAPTISSPGGGSAAATPGGGGYWSLSPNGQLSNHGNATDFGSENSAKLNAAPVAVASTSTGHGYWLAAPDGGVFAFGDAQFYGSMGGTHLNQPIVAMARTADNGGYWLVAADGGVFAFGDAKFYGSTGGMHLNQPITGMAVTPDGGGYWLVASDGGIFSFGDAQFYGSMGGTPLNKHIVGMAGTPDGMGYWLVGGDGGVFTFGDATFYGSLGATGTTPVTGIVPNGSTGYSLITSSGTAVSFGSASL